MKDLIDTDAAAFLLLLHTLDDTDAILLLKECKNYLERPVVPDVHFNFDIYPNANALVDFRFTCAQLMQLASVMNIPIVFITSSGDRLLGIEALSMLCYHLISCRIITDTCKCIFLLCTMHIFSG
ncbi:hypothetical protein GN244_ATG20236 [Phytophthora infestans]|uniref:Uncharacterized protein n=1 Tax=Phytophthora infestans TaxID=4787 RepID=A0A833SDI2_PHYIN|nr:hypothetical protein GN244_ATG20236 [Phytophthora infestans]